MTMPDFQTLMRPVLESVADGAIHSNREVVEAMAEAYDLTPSELAELLPSGRQRRFDNKVNWAMSYLFQAGLVERPARAHIRITEDGRAALAAYPDRIDMKTLEVYPKYLEFKARTRAVKDSAIGASVGGSLVDQPGGSPQELLDAAVAENAAAVEGELLERALALDPKGFELLVIRLLGRMGYGQRGRIEHSGQPGDHGIDGIISQDPLGLDRIYVQAKRYTDTSVQRPEVQKFVGALMGAQGDRGVFITTSRFSQGAIDEAQRVNARIELIDGRRLAELMAQHGVGTQPETTVTLYRVDEDFFETL